MPQPAQDTGADYLEAVAGSKNYVVLSSGRRVLAAAVEVVF